MKQNPEIKTRYFLPKKTITVLVIALSLVAVMSYGFKRNDDVITGNFKHEEVNQDSIESVTAFMDVYKVLMSPRCMNCHPAGDRPLQGNDSHKHIMNVKRGKDGKGLYSLKCANCHQPTAISKRVSSRKRGIGS